MYRTASSKDNYVESLTYKKYCDLPLDIYLFVLKKNQIIVQQFCVIGILLLKVPLIIPLLVIIK